MELTDTLTKAWLKARFLGGVRTTDGRGTELDDGLFDVAIGAAIDLMETELDFSLRGLVTVTDELHDLVWGDRHGWNMMLLHKKPVRSITALKVKWGNYDAAELIPGDQWVRVFNDDAGQIGLMPSTEALSATGQGMPWHLGNVPGGMPGYWLLSYTAGFDGEDYPWPADILHGIGLIAALLPLDTAGDLLVGAGIANSSVSQYGISQTIGTTASATNHGYGAKRGNYVTQLKMMMPLLRGKYRMPFVGAV